MQIVKSTNPQIKAIFIEALSRGGLVVYPTETCYGIGVDASNPDAVSKLLEYKRRTEGRAISIATSSTEMAEEFVELNNTAKSIYESFLPGPITIISKSKHRTDPRLESEKGTLGIRIPAYNLLVEVISELNKPITATSANPYGKKTPYEINDIFENISKKQETLIDLVIDAGTLPHNPPSSVIDTTTEELNIYRTGQIDPNSFDFIESQTSKSTEETINLAENIIEKYNPEVILLNGELGAGKTHFVKGLALSLGINQVIKSPTYNYVNEYKSDSKMLIHFDAWRIQSLDDLEALKFKSWFQENNLVVIEWPTVISNLDSEFFEKIKGYLYIDIIVKDENTRIVKIYRKK